eukprot:CAMPEP_0114506582 /NCGR_PEP_ID=MMETSP0109-20121206/11503_1 /TAXON_ID=29199 /ORGANISM="Chlorarachnion reptans, Strain CCCM449" /LENGTH=463 /DNA_ID=CAMNT_0001685177 /DNA_START=101 /DNA_END=1492 /DNA_ORIENTATION=-
MTEGDVAVEKAEDREEKVAVKDVEVEGHEQQGRHSRRRGRDEREEGDDDDDDDDEEEGGRDEDDGRRGKRKGGAYGGLTREDVLMELKELNRQRRDVEMRLKGLDRDVRGLSRPWRPRREDDDTSRPRPEGFVRPRFDEPFRPRGMGRPTSVVGSIAKRRRDKEEDEDDDRTDDDEEEGADARGIKRRKLYIRKEGPRSARRDDVEEDGDDKPSVPSAIAATRYVPRQRRLSRGESKDKVLQKRNRRMFGFLMGHLGKAKKNLAELKKTAQAKKKKSLEEKVEARTHEMRMEVREYSKKRAERKREKELKMREDILRKQREKHMMLLKLRIADHEKQLANFIRTKKSPGIFWLPAKHNEKTESLVEEMKKMCEDKIKEGVVQGLEEDEMDDIPEWRNFAEPRKLDEDKKDDDNEDKSKDEEEGKEEEKQKGDKAAKSDGQGETQKAKDNEDADEENEPKRDEN